MITPFGKSHHLYTSSFSIHFLSERAITIVFGQGIDEITFDSVHQFNAQLNRLPFEGFISTVPAYASLTVFYDPLVVMHAQELQGLNGFERVCNYLIELQQKSPLIKKKKREQVHLPVCYDEALAPDLAYVASYHNISPEELINLHSGAIYQVYMIGFVPGFAYLGGMPSILETPRKEIPRKQVLAGSIGIAGKQTGIYPLQISGGWQIIGCTPLQLFNIERSSPSLLEAGDEVLFEIIDLQEFKFLSGSNS